VSALSALGAEAIVRRADGARTLAVEDFVTGALETVLGANELLEAIRVPAQSASAQWGYYKVAARPANTRRRSALSCSIVPRNVFRAVLRHGAQAAGTATRARVRRLG